MQKIISNSIRNNTAEDGNYSSLLRFKFNDHLYRAKSIAGLKSKGLAFFIFLFYFLQQGTVILIPEKYLFIYRGVSYSDLLMYALVLYSLVKFREYHDYFTSKSMLLVKILFTYFLLEFILSYVRYGFSPIEYFFRLKGVWTQFMIFPLLLLVKRGGFKFLAKIIFPVAVISNILYILTAVTGTPFLNGVTILRQQLPGGFDIYRVYGGTFYGELFFLWFVYYWITKRFRLLYLAPAILFIIPHILAFGRGTWAYFAFTIMFFITINYINKKLLRILFKHVIILVFLASVVIYGLLKLVPESNYFVRAVESRFTQGKEDVTYTEGTYGTRFSQTNSLLYLWSKNDIFFGVGMHPMWVEGPQSYEEMVYYNAFCDGGWSCVIAAYGLIGFVLSVVFQLRYMLYSFKLVKKVKEFSLNGFFLYLLFAKLLFDTFVSFAFTLFSVNLWGIINVYMLIPFLVVVYEENRKKQEITGDSK